MSEYYLKIAEEIIKLGIQKVAYRRNYTINELLAILDRVSSDGKVSKLERNKYRELLEKKRFFLHLNENRIAVISDTHIGAISANLDYVKRAYDFFDTLKIKTVFHGGDLFDGPEQFKITNKRKCKEKCMDQIYIFSKYYPQGFQNYIILGNHDEKFLDFKIDLVQEIPNFHKDFMVLGYGRTYFDCMSYKISLSHPSMKKALIQYYTNDCNLNLFGHSHAYHYISKSRKMKIPTCSDMGVNEVSEGIPGFLVLNFIDHYIVSQRYIFEGNEIKQADVERIRKK